MCRTVQTCPVHIHTIIIFEFSSCSTYKIHIFIYKYFHGKLSCLSAHCYRYRAKPENSISLCHSQHSVIPTVKILNIGTHRCEQTVQTWIRLLLNEQSDLSLHSLPFHLHFFICTIAMYNQTIHVLGQLCKLF